MPLMPLMLDEVAAAAADGVEVPMLMPVILPIVILDGSFDDIPLIPVNIEDELMISAPLV